MASVVAVRRLRLALVGLLSLVEDSFFFGYSPGEEIFYLVAAAGNLTAVVVRFTI